MEKEKCIFNCETCGKSIEASLAENKIPECCDQPMNRVEELEPCTLSTTAEHSRMDNLGEPCDDGRSGKI